MAEERTLGLARGSDYSTDDSSKEELQRRMDEARESITQTVTGIKDSVVHQYESVKDSISETLDWREQFKKRPVTWSVGALTAGFLTGYCVTNMVKGDGGVRDVYSELYGEHGRDYPPAQRSSATPRSSTAAGFVASGEPFESQSSAEDEGPGLLSRLQETPAYGRIKDEASTIGDQLLSEVTKTAKEIVVPAAVGWVRHWLQTLIPERAAGTAGKTEKNFAAGDLNQEANRSGYQPVTERHQ